MLAIGAGLGADTALIGCASDSRCLGAVLLSPQNAADLEAAMTGYNPRPVLLTASQEDSASLRAAQRVRQSATGSAVLQPFEGAGHGVQILFNRPDMIDLIRDFLNTVTGR
jgi:pimeloyl-ACP methyl ester carboxylesterase